MLTQSKGGITQVEYDCWRYHYLELDTTKH